MSKPKPNTEPIELDGVSLLQAQWAAKLGITRQRMNQRLQSVERGEMTKEEALTTPKGQVCSSSKKRLPGSVDWKKVQLSKKMGDLDCVTLTNGEVHVVKYDDKQKLRLCCAQISRYFGGSFALRSLGDNHLVQFTGATVPEEWKDDPSE